MVNQALAQIVERHKSSKGFNFLQIIAFDDQKKLKQNHIRFFDISKSTLNQIQEEAEIFNTGSYGVFLNINPLCSPERKKEYIKKIQYVFIDLDHATEEHKDLVKIFLEEKKIKYSYISQSGQGYHFLIPIDLDITQEISIKNFLRYLKNNICNKVDIATYTNERLMRFPLSIHNKNNPSFDLKTLFCSMDNINIEDNTKLVLNYQEEEKKGKLDNVYLKSITIDDIFFNEIIFSNDFKYINELKSAQERNNIFIKNLAIWCLRNENNYKAVLNFLNNWEATRINHLEGWLKKAKEQDMEINYKEIKIWALKYKLDNMKKLIDEQLSTSFLDDIEFYFLEDEKPDYSYLIYYPEKNYYVQKNLNGLKDVLYYEAKERGIDLELNLGCYKTKEWAESTFNKKLSIIKNKIHEVLEKQNRIKKVYNINYEPSDEKFIWYENKKYFNIYKSTNYWYYQEIQAKYHFPHIKELIMNLCGEEEKSFNYFNKWLGWQIQNPTKKIPTAIIFQGQQGSGKGIFRSYILDNIFGSNVQEINQTHLESSFNEYLLGKQIIIANEVIHNENKALLPNILKNLVTDTKITIQRKFRKEVEGYNYTHWIFCTNNDNPLKIDQDDRRYNVFYSKKLKGGGNNAVKFVKSMISNLDYELKEYVSYLKSLEIKYEDVHEPIMTDAKRDIQELNKDSVEKFIEYMKQFNNVNELFVGIDGNNYDYNPIDFGSGEEYILTDNFYLIYQKWADKFKEKGLFNKQNFSRRISNNGCNSEPKRKKLENETEYRSFRAYNIESLNNLMVVSEND